MRDLLLLRTSKSHISISRKDTLRAKWVEFVNRNKDFVVTESSRICNELKQEPVTNNYVQSLNHGLTLPPSALNHYTYAAYAILDTYESQI